MTRREEKRRERREGVGHQEIISSRGLGGSILNTVRLVFKKQLFAETSSASLQYLQILVTFHWTDTETQLLDRCIK